MELLKPRRAVAPVFDVAPGKRRKTRVPAPAKMVELSCRVLVWRYDCERQHAGVARKRQVASSAELVDCAYDANPLREAARQHCAGVHSVKLAGGRCSFSTTSFKKVVGDLFLAVNNQIKCGPQL